MKSSFLQGKQRQLTYEDEQPQQGRGLVINSVHSHQPSFSVPSSPIINKHNKSLQRQNTLLDRIRCQLTNIKSQVLKIPRDYNTRTKSIDQFQKYSSNSQFISTKNDIHYPILSYKSNFSNHTEVLNTNYLLLQSKLQQNQLKYKQQKSQLTSALISLQRQLIQKDKQLEQYQGQVYLELQKFKNEVVSHNDSQKIRERVRSLQFTLEDINNEIIYLRKRTQQDGIEIRKLTIDNYELTKLKQKNNVKDTIQQNLKQIIIEDNKRLPSGQSLDSFGLDEFNKLKENNKCMAEEILLQQNTIDVLESELAKSIKQCKRIDTKGKQQLQNVKITYQKLLESVKEGLAQCYRSEIQDLRVQLSKYRETENINIQTQNTDTSQIPLRKTKSKVVTETISEIIIIEQDESLQVTSRKWSPTQSQKLSSSNTTRQQLKKKVQELEQVIQGLEQYVEHLKQTFQQALLQSNNSLQNHDLITKINLISKEKDDIFYQSMMKEYTNQLSDSIISNLLQQELMNKKSLENISAQMQFVIQKLKMRNYEIEKKLRQTEEIVRNKDELIDQLRRCLLDMRQKQSDQTKTRQRVSIQINALEAENFKLQNFNDAERHKSETKLKEVNQQIEQLNNYKIDLDREITRREQKIKILKQEITDILQQEQRKRKNIKLINDERNLRINNGNQQLLIQSDYYVKIIEDLTFQLNDLRNNRQKNTINNNSRKDQDIKQLKSELLKKSQQIFELRNQIAASRLRSDKLRSQQQLQRIDLATDKKNFQLKFQKHIQSLIEDLSLQKQTVQFLTFQLKSLTNPKHQQASIQNIPLQSLIKSRKAPTKQRNNLQSLVLDSLNQPPKLLKDRITKSHCKQK